jgi:hypothetical protein
LCHARKHRPVATQFSGFQCRQGHKRTSLGFQSLLLEKTLDGNMKEVEHLIAANLH